MLRRSSAGLDGQFVRTTVPVRANFDDIRQHLKHLGPSNPATNPNKTRSTTVKVKPGSGVHSALPRSASVAEPATEDMAMEEGDETTSLLKPQMTGKDGIQALSQTYGSVSPAVTVQLAPQRNGVPTMRLDSEDLANKSTQTSALSSQINLDSPEAAAPTPQQPQQASPPQQQQLRTRSSGESTNSAKTENTLVAKRPYVRSGSITENVVESRGVRKVVLQTSGSNDEDESVSAAVAASSSPEQQQQPRLLGRTTFGLFARDSNKDAAAKDKENGKGQVEDAQEEDDEEDDEGDLMSPVPGDEEAPESYAEAAAKGAAVAAAEEAQAGSSTTGGSAGGAGGGGAGKKKNRRKKRKGGKS